MYENNPNNIPENQQPNNWQQPNNNWQQPNNNWQQPNNNWQPPQNNSSKGLAIGALVCGILGIVGAFIPIVCYFTLVLSIVGVILGAKAMKDLPAGAPGRGLAVAGLVLGIIGLAFAVVGVICYSCTLCVACGAANGLAGMGYYY